MKLPLLGRQWRRRGRLSELQPLDPRRCLVDPCHRVGGPLQQRLHGCFRGGTPGLKRAQLVQRRGHHVLEAGELLRHLLHRRLQLVHRGRRLMGCLVARLMSIKRRLITKLIV